MNSETKKAIYVGAPAIFELERCCQELYAAFGDHCYLVGSSLQRQDWRDVDVRMIMDDADFEALFPNAGSHWEGDPRWLLLTTLISRNLSQRCQIPVDFQFQPQTHANEMHKGQRSAMGISTLRRSK